MDDEIVIEIAHFEPHHIKIKAIGYYPGIILSQPLLRLEENFKELFESTKADFISKRRALDDYFLKTKYKKECFNTSKFIRIKQYKYNR